MRREIGANRNLVPSSRKLDAIQMQEKKKSAIGKRSSTPTAKPLTAKNNENDNRPKNLINNIAKFHMQSKNYNK